MVPVPMALVAAVAVAVAGRQATFLIKKIYLCTRTRGTGTSTDAG